MNELAEKLEAGSIPIPEAGCWLWERGANNNGYGVLYFGHPKQAIRAHRAAWLVHRGEIPTGFMVCHRCDTRRCVNPSHLFLGTALDNSQDMIAKGRQDFPKGQRHSKAKLTDDQVIAMRKSGLNSTEAGRVFGVSDSAASQIINGKAWKHLPMFPDVQRLPKKGGRR